MAGARSDLAPAPSVDIANGSPTGAGATDRIVMSYVSGTVDAPHVYFTESTDHGATWSTPRAIETAGDRGIYTAPAISPNGRDVYVVYNAFTTPFQPTTATPRSLVGVVLHADSSTNPGTPTGDDREADERGHAGLPVLESTGSKPAISASQVGLHVGTYVRRRLASRVELSAHSETVSAGCMMPVRPPMQDCPVGRLIGHPAAAPRPSRSAKS